MFLLQHCLLVFVCWVSVYIYCKGKVMLCLSSSTNIGRKICFVLLRFLLYKESKWCVTIFISSCFHFESLLFHLNLLEVFQREGTVSHIISKLDAEVKSSCLLQQHCQKPHIFFFKLCWCFYFVIHLMIISFISLLAVQ